MSYLLKTSAGVLGEFIPADGVDLAQVRVSLCRRRVRLCPIGDIGVDIIVDDDDETDIDEDKPKRGRPRKNG